MWLVNATRTCVDWFNVPVLYRVLRIDLLMCVFFLFSCAWYGYYYGIMGAIQGGVMFITIAALALFMRRQ
jgi:hypothetical protein